MTDTFISGPGEHDMLEGSHTSPARPFGRSSMNVVRNVLGWWGSNSLRGEREFYFLDAFRKIAKSGLLASLRLSVCPHGTTWPSHWTDFREIRCFGIFRKSAQKIQVSLQSDNNNRYYTWRPIYTFFIISRSVLLRTKNVSDKICRENQDTHFVFSSISSLIVPFMR